MPVTLFPKLPLRARAELFAQLAQMEAAGLPPDRVFGILNITTSNAQSRLNKMRELIKRMDPATAGERSGLFTTLEARLVRASLTAGSPAKIYQRLADVYTQRAMQVASMKAKMTLPAFMLLASLLITPLPNLAAGAYGLSTYIWQVLRPILFIAALIFGIRWLISRPTSANSNSASSLLALPIAGKLIIRHNCRDFFESLALMLEAGVSMLDALPIAIDTVANASIKRDFAQIGPRVAAGATLSEAMTGLRYLGSDTSRERVISFTYTGENSGTLPEMLMRHVTFETDAINDSMELLATWAPRIIYGFVAAWIAISILSGPGIVPRMPEGV
jgi:type II secretory pathway component PulF